MIRNNFINYSNYINYVKKKKKEKTKNRINVYSMKRLTFNRIYN